MNEQRYPYDEFLDHFRAMQHVLKYETVHTDYSDLGRAVEVGDDHSLEMNMGRILDYFAQLQYPEEKRMYQGPRLAMILTYLVEHFPYFDQERLVVIGADDSPSLVKGPLLQALHEHFAKPGLPNETTPEAMVARARELEKQDDQEDSEQ